LLLAQLDNHNQPLERREDMGTLLLIVLILLVIGALPVYPYSRSWGYYPSSTVGVILLIIILLVLMGRI
jgi:hypothetical protein